eukprot:159890-Hanusia_phi.AAC.1
MRHARPRGPPRLGGLCQGTRVPVRPTVPGSARTRSVLSAHTELRRHTAASELGTPAGPRRTG